MFFVPKTTNLYKKGVYHTLEYNNEYIRNCTNHYIELPLLEESKVLLKSIKSFKFYFQGIGYIFENNLTIDKSIFDYLLLKDKKDNFIHLKITSNNGVEKDNKKDKVNKNKNVNKNI